MFIHKMLTSHNGGLIN